MSKITITLSSAAMGKATESDFDRWASYVCEHVDDGTGVDVDEVGQQRFGEAGEDIISGATAEERDAIRRWLSVDGWEAFCAS